MKLKFEIWVIIIFTSITLIFASNCYAAAYPSSDLIEKAKELDGKKVDYKGEVVGAVLKRGENSWINLNDGANAIGVWCKSPALHSVKFIGNYKCKGDLIRVSGEFHRACPDHDGELDIHADTVKIIIPGRLIKESIDSERLNYSAILFLASLLTIYIFRKKF